MIQQAALLLLAALPPAAHPGDANAPAESPRAATITGTVMCRDSNQAADSFGVYLRSTSSRQVQVIRGEGGRFVGSVAPGRYEIALVAPGYDIFCRTINVNEGDLNTLRVVRLSAGSAKLTVDLRDAAGEPLAGHRVHLVRAFSPGRDPSCEAPIELTSLDEVKVEDMALTETADAMGRVAFSKAPSGPAALVVEPPTGLPWPPQFLVVYEGEARELVLQQEKPCTLAIHLTDRAGQIVLPELIQVERESDGLGMHATCSANFCCDTLQATPLAPVGPVPFPRLSRHYHVWVPGPSGDEDSVMLPGLTPGTWRVKVRVGGAFLPVQSVDVAGSITQIELRLPAAGGASDPETVAAR